MAKSSGSSQRQKDRKIAGFYYRRKFRGLRLCIYCGQKATTLDHVFPLKIAASLDLSKENVREHLKFGLRLVPSCRECNTLAGPQPFRSILEKRRYIQKRLRDKYLKMTRTIMWSRDEIDELGPNMRREVIKMLNNRHVLEQRICWPRASLMPVELIDLFRVRAVDEFLNS